MPPNRFETPEMEMCMGRDIRLPIGSSTSSPRLYQIGAGCALRLGELQIP